ncbi:MAG: hypothetical protein JXB50_02415 [Spirochaetes bacterium]|nr:hypothetical protein [Spirochaetota bacterium]
MSDNSFGKSKAIREVKDDELNKSEVNKTEIENQETSTVKEINYDDDLKVDIKYKVTQEKKESKRINLFDRLLYYKKYFEKFFNFYLVLIITFTFLFLVNLYFKNVFIMLPFYIISIFALAGYYIYFFKKTIQNKIIVPIDLLNEIANGNLDHDIDENTELKEKLTDFASVIDNIIKKMSDTVNKVELSAMDLAGNSDALTYFASSMADKTNDQTEAITNIDASAQKMNDSMQEIKVNVESAYNISRDSIKEADKGSEEILSLIEEMNRINDMSDEIVNTMNFIDDIADETNLLALNAAIQAAHAGEEGKGFGVVATEIKNLAESSSKATKTIYQIIEKTVESISKGVKASERAKKELVKIISSIKQTEDLMFKINESINKQTMTTSKLKESLENIQSLTNNINEDTQNMKSAISNLSGQAQILKSLISTFKIKHGITTNDSIYGIEIQ